MGFFKNLLKKFNEGFFYVLDMNTLYEYLRREAELSLEEKLAAVANLNIYFGSEKHNIMAWNYEATDEEQEKGLKFYYDDEEYATLDELYTGRLRSIEGFVKIELIETDSVFLNEYMSAHPELNPENF